MSEKNKTVINQLYRYYNAEERKGGEWFLPELPMLESKAYGLAHLAIADQLQQLVTQLRTPVGEWIEVTPETLPKPHDLCVLLVAKGRGMFAFGKLNKEKEWYFIDYGGTPEPLYYLLLPVMTKEMHEKFEEWVEAQGKDEEL